MATRAGIPTLLAMALALAPVGAAGQTATHVGLSLGFGSLWDGFRFDLAHYDFSGYGHTGVGFSVGGGGAGVWADASLGYGIYGESYRGWARSPGHHVHDRRDRYHFGRSVSCWDVWYGGYSPVDYYYQELFYDCVLLGPRWSFDRWRRVRARRPWFRRGGIYVGVHWRDPFWDPWGPYWAYDPWGTYWDGWIDGYGWATRYGWEPGTVGATAGRGTTATPARAWPRSTPGRDGS